MPNPITAVLGGLLKPVGDIFTKREERKLAKLEAEATLDRIMAEAAAADSTVAGQIALVNASNQNNSWKDEFALVTIAAPFWVAMILGPLGYGDVITHMFAAMNQIPEFWQQTFQWGILGALGVTQLTKAVKR